MRLESKRLILRDFSDADYEAVHRFGSDPEVSRYMDWGPNTPEDTRNFLKSAQMSAREMNRLEYEMAIVLRDSGELIGSGGIRVKSLQNRSADFGYCLNRDFWGQGYATEAAELLLEFGFTQLNMHRIWATCAPDNLGSARVLEKAGLSREGHLRDAVWAKGKWRDSLMYSILEPEWKSS